MEGRDYALIRLDESKINIADVARIVAGVEGRPLADVSMRLKASRGIIAEHVERDVAEGMAKVLEVRGIRCTVVPTKLIAATPKPKRCTQLTLSARKLVLKGRGDEESCGWDDIELVNCGRVRLLDHQPDRGSLSDQGMARSAPVVGLSGLPAIALGRRRYVRTVREDPYSLVMDIFARANDGHYRFYEGLSEVRLPDPRGKDPDKPMSRDRRLARTIIEKATGASFGAALPLLAEGKSLHSYTFTSEPSYNRYTNWLLQSERIKRESPEGR